MLSNFAGVLDFIDGNDVDINAGDLVPGNLKKDIFKQCVLADLQLTDGGVTDAKERYEATMARLPEVLALEDKDVASARAEVGKAIATKYCAAALQQKLAFNAQDQAFVADLGERLGTDLGDVFRCEEEALWPTLDCPLHGGPEGAGRARRRATRPWPCASTSLRIWDCPIKR